MRNLTISITSIKKLRTKWRKLLPKYKNISFFYRKIQTVLNAFILFITKINNPKDYLSLQTEKVINKNLEIIK